ncbi:MAG: hypothetical protein ACMUJM_12540 [bacterium]
MKRFKFFFIMTIIAVLVFYMKLGICRAGDKFNLDLLQSQGQAKFEEFCEEISPVFTYKSYGIAVPLGIIGLEASVEFNGATVDKDLLRELGVLEDPPSMIGIPRLAVRKGLPFKIDVGAIYSALDIEDESLNLMGFEVKYPLLEGSSITPALAVRANYLSVQGIDDFSASSMGADLLFSKGLGLDFLFKLVPYGGVSYNSVSINPDNEFSALDEAKTDIVSLFGGLRLSMAVMRFNVKVDYDIDTQNMNYGLSVGIGL